MLVFISILKVGTLSALIQVTNTNEGINNMKTLNGTEINSGTAILEMINRNMQYIATNPPAWLEHEYKAIIKALCMAYSIGESENLDDPLTDEQVIELAKQQLPMFG